MPKKIYASADEYERKLARVMERLGVEQYNFNWDRWGCWVQFRYKGELYQFEHSVDKARSRGQKLDYGSDALIDWCDTVWNPVTGWADSSMAGRGMNFQKQGEYFGEANHLLDRNGTGDTRRPKNPDPKGN